MEGDGAGAGAGSPGWAGGEVGGAGTWGTRVGVGGGVMGTGVTKVGVGAGTRIVGPGVVGTIAPPGLGPDGVGVGAPAAGVVGMVSARTTSDAARVRPGNAPGRCLLRLRPRPSGPAIQHPPCPRRSLAGTGHFLPAARLRLPGTYALLAVTPAYC